ncbi:hypothetical protein MRX96_012942 [Rhipicephalus microplus]
MCDCAQHPKVHGPAPSPEEFSTPGAIRDSPALSSTQWVPGRHLRRLCVTLGACRAGLLASPFRALRHCSEFPAAWFHSALPGYSFPTAARLAAAAKTYAQTGKEVLAERERPRQSDTVTAARERSDFHCRLARGRAKLFSRRVHVYRLSS